MKQARWHHGEAAPPWGLPCPGMRNALGLGFALSAGLEASPSGAKVECADGIARCLISNIKQP